MEDRAKQLSQPPAQKGQTKGRAPAAAQPPATPAAAPATTPPPVTAETDPAKRTVRSVGPTFLPQQQK